MNAAEQARVGVGPSAWHQRWQVARWEFRRFVKPKQLLVSLVITLILGVAGYMFARLARNSAQGDVAVAVIGGEELSLPGRSADGVVFVSHPASARDSLLREVARRNVDGVLEVVGADNATLHVRRERPWRSRVEREYAQARQAIRLGEAGLTRTQLEALVAPPSLEVRVMDAERGGKAARLTAAAASGAVLYGVFMAMALMLVSVTAEKQLRVTEQLIATIRPQEWIDGKIIGIALTAMVNVVLMALSAILFLAGRALATGRWSAPQAIDNPVLLGTILLFALLGFAFWLSFFGAIAATIDDPNTSSRGPLMFVPILFQGAGFMILSNPDSTFARTLSIIPLTASGAMPIRLASSDVAPWEVALSAALLLAGVLILRRLAGRVFALGMLMTGKEPSWSEVRRWMRET